MGVAQLVRAPGCGSGGRGFETHHPPSLSLIFNGENHQYFLLGKMAELVDALDLESSGLSSWGFKSPLSHHLTTTKNLVDFY